MKKAELQSKYQLLIGGQWKDASDGKLFKTTCPADGSFLAECAEATREDVDEAVAAAWKAFESWKNTTVAERAAVLNKIADIIDANKEHLAMVESMDNGKPIRETLAVDVPMAADHFRYFAGCILAEEGSANMLGNTTLSLILREPIGVVGQIVPWNFPFLMAAWKLAPVLASGCFLRPTLLGDVTNHMRVAQEEIFGPVACILKFKTEEEVIAMANDSEYGLGGAVWTRDINRALRVARGVETGRMWVNTYNAIPEGAPFGGYKQSGIGRETHKVILDHYTQMKNIMINLAEVPTGFYPAK